MVGPDRTMLSVTKACAYKKVTEGIMRGWIKRGKLTKGKIISVDKNSNQRSIIGVYVDELDKIMPKEQKRKILDRITFNQILKGRNYPSVRTIDILKCPQCHLQMRNLYCIQCRGIPTVPIYSRMCHACGKDLVKKSYENPDEFGERQYCNTECASKYPKPRGASSRVKRSTMLTKIRLEKNMVLKDISRKTGMDIKTINRIEAREIKASRLKNIKKIADALGVNIKEIASSKNQPSGKYRIENGWMQWR